MTNIKKPFLFLPLRELGIHEVSQERISPNEGKPDVYAVINGEPEVRYDLEMGYYTHFDGQDDWLDVKGLEHFDDRRGFTISVWVRFEDFNSRHEIVRLNRKIKPNSSAVNLTSSLYGENKSTITLKLGENDNEYTSLTSDSLEQGTWVHIAATIFNDSYLRLFVNGEIVQEDTPGPNQFIWSSIQIAKGKENYSGERINFKGGMTRFRLYDVALEHDEIPIIMSEDKINKDKLSPLLHLPLDEIQYDTTTRKNVSINKVPLGVSAVLHGDPKISYDPEMGSCMLFNGVGDYIEITKMLKMPINKGFSFAVWAMFDNLSEERIFFMNDSSTAHSVWLGNDEETSKLRLWLPSDDLYTSPAIIPGTWQHLAVTMDPDDKMKMCIYVNGVELITKSLDESNFSGLFDRFLLGHDDETFFTGGLAHFRFYDYPLDLHVIREIMKLDKSSMASFRESAQFKIELYTIRDNNHVPIIYVESNNNSEPLELKISNPTGKKIDFDDYDEPSEDTFHFQMCFRKNVVAPNVLNTLRQATDKKIGKWKYALIDETAGEKEDWISFIHEDGADFELYKGTSALLQLPKFSASSRGGARNTRVEVRYKVKGQETGSIIRHMEIQSHLGLKDIPLTPQIIGSNTVLNNGVTPNELTIEILHIKKKGSVELSNEASAPSKFELVVGKDLFMDVIDDQSESHNMILRADTNRSGIHSTTLPPGTEYRTFEFVTENPNMQIDSNIDKDGNRQNVLTIHIRNWVTHAESGIHNLLLRYENIPGYWDGTWIIPVQLGPLVERNIDEEERVGIGTDEPEAKLHVMGETIIEDGPLNVIGETVLDGGTTVYGDTVLHGALTVDEGDATINGSLHVKDGSQGVNKILRSDADGKASWHGYNLGDKAHGGIVFWLDETGQHGLVCSKEDLGDSEWGGKEIETNAYFNGIFGGNNNTVLIISKLGWIDCPAVTCANLKTDNYGDWYLPSKYELYLMAKALFSHKLAKKTFTYELYWSSMEHSATEACIVEWANHKTEPNKKPFPKIDNAGVRAVRAF